VGCDSPFADACGPWKDICDAAFKIMCGMCAAEGCNNSDIGCRATNACYRLHACDSPCN
jgi:hypothetical protein